VTRATSRWAALHLGRLEGDAAGDPALLSLAAGARLELAVDRAAAAAVQASAASAPEPARLELERRFEIRWGIVGGA